MSLLEKLNGPLQFLVLLMFLFSSGYFAAAFAKRREDTGTLMIAVISGIVALLCGFQMILEQLITEYHLGG